MHTSKREKPRVGRTPDILRKGKTIPTKTKTIPRKEKYKETVYDYSKEGYEGQS